MKLKITVLASIFMGMAALGTWRVRAGTESQGAAGGRGKISDVPNAEQAEDARQMQVRIKDREREIRGRLGLPALIAESGDPGEDAEIMELYHSGWMINASLEEVEAAKAAAGRTPELDDDVAARVLAHRASCRYFFSN